MDTRQPRLRDPSCLCPPACTPACTPCLHPARCHGQGSRVQHGGGQPGTDPVCRGWTRPSAHGSAAGRHPVKAAPLGLLCSARRPAKKRLPAGFSSCWVHTHTPGGGSDTRGVRQTQADPGSARANEGSTALSQYCCYFLCRHARV